MPDSYADAAAGSADKLLQAERLLDEFLDDYDPNLYLVEDATAVMVRMTKMERRLEAGRLSTARRLEKAHVYRHEGFKSAGGWLSTITGQGVGQAAASLETARAIEEQPLVQEAFSSGRLSGAQAKEIASASEACPDEARNLLDQASRLNLGELKRRCAEIRSVAGSAAEEIAREEKIRKTRFCKTWVDSEGAGRLEARMTTEALGIFRSVLGEYEKQVFSNARRSGIRESRQAYAADALVAMAVCSVAPEAPHAATADADPAGTDLAGADHADTFDDAVDDLAVDDVAGDPVHRSTGDPAGRPTFCRPRALVRVVVSAEALLRGHVGPGETCEILGSGPVPVSLARELIPDAILELVVTKGVDVTTVVSDSRYVRKALRIALEQRDQVCVVPHCNVSYPLERDHWQVDYANHGPTELDNLARLCLWHHHQKTDKGWRLVGPPGQWQFLPPDQVAALKPDEPGEEKPDRAAGKKPEKRAAEKPEPPTGESGAGPPSPGAGPPETSTGPPKKPRPKDPPIQPPLL